MNTTTDRQGAVFGAEARELLRKKLIEKYGVDAPADMTLAELFAASPTAEVMGSIPPRSQAIRDEIASRA